jgi:hypothetical protein
VRVYGVYSCIAGSPPSRCVLTLLSRATQAAEPSRDEPPPPPVSAQPGPLWRQWRRRWQSSSADENKVLADGELLANGKYCRSPEAGYTCGGQPIPSSTISSRIHTTAQVTCVTSWAYYYTPIESHKDNNRRRTTSTSTSTSTPTPTMPTAGGHLPRAELLLFQRQRLAAYNRADRVISDWDQDLGWLLQPSASRERRLRHAARRLTAVCGHMSELDGAGGPPPHQSGSHLLCVARRWPAHALLLYVVVCFLNVLIMDIIHHSLSKPV